MVAVPPDSGFNAALRELCHAHGALLILDEVMTGFRVSAAGWFGLEHVAADLYTFGKVMSGGLPAAAFGGSAELMSYLAPAGPVYHAGTLSGNPVAVAARVGPLRAPHAALFATVGVRGWGGAGTWASRRSEATGRASKRRSISEGAVCSGWAANRARSNHGG